MLVLPIVNKKRVMNVELKLKTASKVRQGVCYDDAKESEIIVNRDKFSESSFIDSRDISAPVDFIRSRSILYPRNFLVTTKSANDSDLYDVYTVTPPPKKVTVGLDNLYAKAITDLRKEIPGVQKRGKYISLSELGVGEHLTDDKIARLQHIVREVRDEERWPVLFKEAGIADLSDTIDFINNFECRVISDTSIPEDSLQDTLRAMEVINTRDYRHLNKYYRTAKANADIYAKLSYVNKILYGKPLGLIMSKNQAQKQLVKKKDEVDYKIAA